MSSLLVFSAANRRYEPFVLPYMAGVLFHNVDTTVEIAVEDAGRFRYGRDCRCPWTR